MFKGLLNKTASVIRKTDEILSSTSLLAISGVTYQPAEEFTILAEVNGISSGGTITITGLVDGVTTNEELVFSASDEFKQTSNLFTQITGMTQAGFVDGTVIAKLRMTGGGAGYTDIPYISNMNCRIEERREAPIYTTPGTAITSKVILWCITEGASMILQDTVVSGNLRYQVKEILPRETAHKVHHYEIGMERI